MIHHVVHVTEYLYSERVSTSHHNLHLLPRATSEQSCVHEELEISPPPAMRRERVDDFGNRCTYVEIHEPHNNLRVTSRADVEVAPRAPLPATSAPWEAVRDAVRAGATAETRAARHYVFTSPHVPTSTLAREYALSSFTAGRGIIEAARALTTRINKDFVYDSRATTIATPVDEVMRLRRGVCQDFAHVQIACLRALGLPARYVSGYLVTRPPPGKPRLVGADASHAWLSVFAPSHGWIPLDPTNDIVPGEQHITVAWGRDYSDVTPVRGVIMGGGRHDLWVSVDVSPGEANKSEASPGEAQTQAQFQSSDTSETPP
ncbi:MAG TPA: transglutaminase family protein [Polyangia bacterium]|nr:transglutaminase family protein [Polyangia bacterium]